MTTLVDETNNNTIADVSTLMSDADALAREMSGASGDKLQDLREKLRTKLRFAKDRLVDAQQVVTDRAKAVARATDDYVHENPWKSIAAAAAVGFIIGLLVNRR